MSRSGREVFPDFRVVGSPFRMSGSNREALLDVREWSGDPIGCFGVVERPSWISGSGRDAVTDVREWSEGPLVCPRLVWRP